jgi:hypothetical protein
VTSLLYPHTLASLGEAIVIPAYYFPVLNAGTTNFSRVFFCILKGKDCKDNGVNI